MKPVLRVLEPGAHSSVQDAGRFGLQALGVPVSGVLDAEAMRLANALVGNPPGTAVLEILHEGPALEVRAASARVALAGTAGGMEIEGLGTALAGRSVRLERGQVLRVGRLADSACCCLAVAGGFDLEPCLGSLSTYPRAALGGLHGRGLRRGDRLPLRLAEAPEGGELRLPAMAWGPPQAPVRVVLGPQQDRFTRRALRHLRESRFSVSAEADRMGMRLDGPRLAHRGAYDLVSDGIATGAIQVPGSGQPIVLLADHQTTGGYPKIATVISADLPALGRCRPGDALRFRVVGVAEATRIRRAREARLRGIEHGLRPAPAALTGLDPEALRAENLISGVVGAPQ